VIGAARRLTVAGAALVVAAGLAVGGCGSSKSGTQGCFSKSAATGRQLWSRTLIGNDREGIDMAPGYNDGTVYVSTVPVNPNKGQYLGGAKATLWALNAATGAPEWSWDEVQNLWGNPAAYSGGGLWDPPSFDSEGNIYIGVANPGPIAPTGWPAGYPWGTSRPGPDLYTDSVVKLSRNGKLLWYYQLTPHDLYDWDLQNSPVLTTAHGQPVVIDGGKAGILIELNAQTGKLLWKLPVGVHSGHDNDGLITENATPVAHIPLPAKSRISRCRRSSALSPACSAASSPSWRPTDRRSSPLSTTLPCRCR
jgi:PQQ-like domain